MSKKNKQVEALKASVPQETSRAETVEEFASEVLAAFEKEVESAKVRQKGMSLPMNEIIGAIDMVFDVTGSSKSPVTLMAEKVALILEFKYKKMSETATREIPVKIRPNTIVLIPEKDLRAMRLSQLVHMKDSKTDNLYRRIYNIGSRAEYGRFNTIDSMIIRLKKVGEDIPQ